MFREKSSDKLVFNLLGGFFITFLIKILRYNKNVNEITIRNSEIEILGAIKDRLEATYRCEFRKELLSYYLIKQRYQ